MKPISSQAIERIGMIGLLATGLIWMEAERRSLKKEIAEVRREWADERKANAELLNDFRAYSTMMVAAMRGGE